MKIMKKILFILMMTLMSFNSISANNFVDDKNFLEKELYVINVNIPVKLKIYLGDEFTYQINTNDDDLKEAVKCELNNEEIKIYIDDKSSYYKSYYDDEWVFDENKIRINLVVPKDYYNNIKIKTNSNDLLVKNIKINLAKDYENK
jgi:hypothetical protein